MWKVSVIEIGDSYPNLIIVGVAEVPLNVSVIEIGDSYPNFLEFLAKQM